MRTDCFASEASLPSDMSPMDSARPRSSFKLRRDPPGEPATTHEPYIRGLLKGTLRTQTGAQSTSPYAFFSVRTTTRASVAIAMARMMSGRRLQIPANSVVNSRRSMNSYLCGSTPPRRPTLQGRHTKPMQSRQESGRKIQSSSTNRATEKYSAETGETMSFLIAPPLSISSLAEKKTLGINRLAAVPRTVLYLTESVCPQGLAGPGRRSRSG